MKICTTLLFCCVNLLCASQKSAFYLFTTDLKITLCLNDKQCTQTPSTSIHVQNIPNEIVGVEIKNEQGKVLFRDVLFLNLDTNYYFSLQPEAEKLIARRVKPTPLYNPLQIIYEGAVTSTSQNDSLLASNSILEEEDTLENKEIFESNSPSGKENKPTIISYGAIKNKQEEKKPITKCSKVADSPFIRNTRNEVKKIIGFSAQLSFLETQLTNYCLYSDQLKDVLKVIEEDNAKLDIISSLKHNILDPNKLMDLESLFLFEPSIDELERIKNSVEND